jgi:hypothetical protein
MIVVVLCYAVLASLTTINYMHMRSRAARGGEVFYVRNFQPAATLGRKQLLLASVIGAGDIANRPIQTINLPAITIAMLVDGVSGSWPDDWQPAAFGPAVNGVFAWRGLIFPLYCVPFWWFAGLGLDALFARRQLRWPVFLLGALFSGFFVFIWCGLRFGLDASDRVDNGWIYIGLGLWATLYLAFPVAWVRQFRGRRGAAVAAAD